MMKYFEYEHLPEHLQEVSKMFYELAKQVDEMNVMDPREQQVALRKLLEAKDAAVRSMV